MSVEIRNPREDALITSVYIETDESPHVRVTVRVRGQTAGTLTVDRVQGFLLPAALLGEDAPLVRTLERCVSLVQSMAKWEGDVNSLPIAWLSEAEQIAKDAGWEPYQ